jgi:AraC-like DNA-binding protein
VADYPAGARLPTRVIDDFEFVWMLRGRARYRQGDHEVPLVPGWLLLVPPGVEHSFTWDPRRPTRHGYVHFGASKDLGMTLTRMTSHDPLAGLCSYLLWLRDEQAIREALAFMLTIIPLPETHPEPSPLIRQAMTHLRGEWAHLPLRRISVEELAEATHVSRGYLNRLFRRTFDINAAKALEDLRFARAETLLSRTDLTIESIAGQCGFADLSHFSHRFTLVHGVPPSAYRTHPTASVLDHPGIRRLNQLVTGESP